MAEINQGSQGLEVSPQPDAASIEGDRQSMLLKLAERTVLQAEALAQEITDHARQESEAEGARLLAQYTDQAKETAKQTIESAQSRSATLISEATAEALAESEKMLSKAQSESEKMLSKAQSESEKMLSKAQAESEEMLSNARSESEEGLGKAQSEGQEVLGKARQEALAIINASQARADSTESNARLKAEFFIRQSAQNVADGIRNAVLETCNNLLLTVEEFGKEGPEVAAVSETAMLEEAVPSATGESASPEGTSGRKPKSSGRKRIAA